MFSPSRLVGALPCLGVFITGCTLLPAAPARAGWVVDGYLYSGDTLEHHQTYHYLSDRIERGVHPERSSNHKQEPHYYGDAVGFGLSYYIHPSTWHGTPFHYLPGQPKAGDTYGNLSIRAVLTWVPRDLLDENGEAVGPDPADTPPRSVWIYERARFKALRTQGNPRTENPSVPTPVYSPENLYQGQGLNLTWKLGFESEGALTRPPTTSSGNPDGGGDWFTVVQNELEGFNLYRYDTRGQGQITLPAVHFDGKIAIPDPQWKDGRTVDAELYGSYLATPVNFELKTRRLGTTGPFSEWSAIAAGGKDTPEHKAQVQLRLTDGLGRPLGGIPATMLPGLKASDSSKEGVAVDPTILGPVNSNGEPLTGADLATDGEGRINLGTVKSSDIRRHLGPLGPVIVELNLPKTKRYAGANIAQFMDGTWSMGYEGELPWETNMIPGQVHQVVFRGHLPNEPETKVRQHRIKFMVSRARVTEVDQETKQAVERIYTSNPDEVQEPEGVPVIHKSIEEVNTLFVNDVKFNPAVVDEFDANHPAFYKTEMRIEQSDRFWIHELELVAQDQGVYERNLPVAGP